MILAVDMASESQDLPLPAATGRQAGCGSYIVVWCTVQCSLSPPNPRGATRAWFRCGSLQKAEPQCHRGCWARYEIRGQQHEDYCW